MDFTPRAPTISSSAKPARAAPSAALSAAVRRSWVCRRRCRRCSCQVRRTPRFGRCKRRRCMSRRPAALRSRCNGIAEIGDTNNPIAGATGFTYVTPILFTNMTCWARMTHAGGTVDSGAATVFLTSGQVSDSGALTDCDHKFNRPSGPGQLSGSMVFYKTFVFQVTTDGTYTFSVGGNFNARMFLYSGVFSPANPLLNLNNVPLSSPFNATLLSGPNKYYLVIAGDDEIIL